MSIFKNIEDWYKEPFKENMNIWHWFLFAGLIITFAVFWFLIVNFLEEI